MTNTNIKFNYDTPTASTNTKSLKLFVGGYYDDNIYKGEYFDNKTPFGKTINAYTLDEALRLGFVAPAAEWYEEQTEQEFDTLTDSQKVQVILDYTDDDDIAGLIHFETEAEATSYKQAVLTELAEIAGKVEYTGREQDANGYSHKVYQLKNEKKRDGREYKI